MALTKTQIEYAKSKIARAKTTWLQTRIDALGEQPDLTCPRGESLRMISDGTARLNSAAKDGIYRSDVLGYFDFPRHPNADAAEAWTTQRNAPYAEADAIEERLVDKLIMSPDGLTVLAEIIGAFK